MRKFAVLILTFLVCTSVFADEGMWLFNRPPRALLKQRYNFDVTDAWLEHLQKSSVRFNSGGSSSFVSPDGLLLTNHHVGEDCLNKISTKEHDYIRDGFVAKTQADEVKCVDLEVNVLQSIEDVTARVNAAVTPGMSAVDADRARRAVMNTIEQESTAATGLRSDIVPLFQGGEYHLYRYKKYTDVRLVFAPEISIAAFGGDPDNFEYPRYDLDIAFFRAYENGKPVHTDHYLEFNPNGPKEGDLVFVTGHPGGTNRLDTVAQLEFNRDVRLPFVLDTLRRREVLLTTWGARDPENERRAHDELRSIQNSRKALLGQLAGLQDPAVMAAKRDAEAKLKAAVAADPKLTADIGDPWSAIDKIMQRQRQDYFDRLFVVNGYAFQSDLFHIGQTIVTWVNEVPKPNAERFREFRESNLETLKQGLYSEAPVYKDLETLRLADSLSHWAERFPNDPLLQQVLAGKSPNQRAAELVRDTKLADVAFRKQLVEGGKAAVDASNDPMIQVARMIDARYRELRRGFETEIQEPQRQAFAKIANTRFRVLGAENTYPDATFTLRMTFGTVKGYDDASGTHVPWATTIAGVFDRAASHKNQPPFDLPKSWLDDKAKLDAKTPFNFIFTSDIIGGNSGSPIVNRNGEFVGIVFDMNLPSLVYQFAYKEDDARAVGVDSTVIVESLRKVYGATKLLGEIGVK